MKNKIQAKVLSAFRRDVNSFYRELWREKEKWNLDGMRAKRRRWRTTARVALRMYFRGDISQRCLASEFDRMPRTHKAVSSLPERWPA